jgi:molybdopterin-binding protein
MKISARNVFKGKIVKLTVGAVNTEVTIEIEGGAQVVSIITENLGLKLGKKALAVIKASNVMIAVE